MIRFRPAALILRFFGAGAGFGTASAFFISAQRFRCAAAIRFRAAALIVRFFGVAGPESTSADFSGRLSGTAIKALPRLGHLLFNLRSPAL